MIFYYSDLFKEKVKLLNENEKKELKSKLSLMFENIRHPSLRTKKIQGTKDIFEVRINIYVRMTWQYYEDGILLRNIGEHDKTLNNP